MHHMPTFLCTLSFLKQSSLFVQNEQLRAELMQERSSKQDLELDKNSLERQVRNCNWNSPLLGNIVT